MKRVVFPLLFVMALAARGADMDEDPPEQIGAAASGDLRVMALRGIPDEKSDGGLTVWVESGKARADLPPSPVAIEGDAEGSTWSLPIPPEVAVSPNEHWLFATQKVCTGYRIGYLYKRGKGLKFAIATKTRFDAMAWRFFGKTEGVDVEKLIASDSPAHLIDFEGFSDRYVGVSLRGVIDNVPAAKKVASNLQSSAGPTGVYDWQCLYDLEGGKFVVPSAMKVHDLGAWRRWADVNATTWSTAVESELNAAFRALITKLDPAAQKKLREEQWAWLKKRDAQRDNADFDLVDFTRRRAVELQMREQAAQ